MREATSTPLGQWIAAWLTHQRSLGRGYDREQWVLEHLQRFVASTNAADLDQPGFDRWCNPSHTCRRRRAVVASWPSASSASSGNERNRIASRRTRSTSLGCALTGAP